jgi:hypothetical protein
VLDYGPSVFDYDLNVVLNQGPSVVLDKGPGVVLDYGPSVFDYDLNVVLNQGPSVLLDQGPSVVGLRSQSSQYLDLRLKVQ